METIRNIPDGEARIQKSDGNAETRIRPGNYKAIRLRHHYNTKENVFLYLRHYQTLENIPEL